MMEITRQNQMNISSSGLTSSLVIICRVMAQSTITPVIQESTTHYLREYNTQARTDEERETDNAKFCRHVCIISGPVASERGHQYLSCVYRGSRKIKEG